MMHDQDGSSAPVSTIRERLGQKAARVLERQGGDITQENTPHFADVLSVSTARHAVEALLADDAALEAVARDSYLHTLGFMKIALTVPKGAANPQPFELRLHIWPAQNNAVTHLEGRHLHSWPFASRVLLGAMENQQYSVRALTNAEQQVAQKLEAALASIPAKTAAELDESIEKLEAISLHQNGSHILDQDSGIYTAGDQAALVERIKAITGLADDEIALLGKIFEKRVTQLGTKGDYTHVVDQRIGMELAAVDHNRAGDLYFSHVDTAHRLMIPRDHMAATLMLEGPSKAGKKSGSVTRPTHGRGEDIQYHRSTPTTEELRELLQEFLLELDRNKWVARGGKEDRAIG